MPRWPMMSLRPIFFMPAPDGHYIVRYWFHATSIFPRFYPHLKLRAISGLFGIGARAAALIVELVETQRSYAGVISAERTFDCAYSRLIADSTPFTTPGFERRAGAMKWTTLKSEIAN